MRSSLRKRAFDLAIAVPLVLIVLPVMAALAVMTAVSLRAWPFFVHTRVGRDGRPFRFLKLRTLPPSAPRYATKYEIRTVPRSRFSGWLRTRHLDELPQLLLVITGRMSLVGPRPEMFDLHNTMEPAFAEARTRVRPGCAGLWQIGDDCGGLISESPAWDLFYLRSWSVRLDLWILLRTALVALGMAPTTGLEEVPDWSRGNGLLPYALLDDVEAEVRRRSRVTLDLTRNGDAVHDLSLRVSPAGS